MSESIRTNLNDRLSLICPEDCLAQCGALDYAPQAAESVEERAREGRDITTSDGKVPKIEVTCRGKRKKYYLWGDLVCREAMDVTILADQPYTLGVDWHYYNRNKGNLIEEL